MIWNKLEDVEPVQGQTVIAWAPDGSNQVENLMLQCYFGSGRFIHGFHNHELYGVTDWMPMPLPPQEREDFDA